MKLVYLAQIGLFDDWAHTVQIMKMCEGFTENGVEVELVVPKRKNPKNLDPFEYNHTEKTFKITKVPYIDLFFGNPSPVLYWIRLISFFISARLYLIFSEYDVLYTRELYAGPFFRTVFIERHSFPKVVKSFDQFVFEKVGGLIVLTSFIKSRLVEIGIDENKILVSHDAVRLEDFTDTPSKREARRKLKLSDEDYLIGYVGTLKTMGMEKGVSTAIESLKFLPAKYKLYIVGGELYDIEFYKDFAEKKNLTNRVIFAGRVLHEKVPLNISACDILTAPFPENEHYSFFMSPLKIFEYMASKRPIIVTNLQSLKEILVDGNTALFIPPSDPKALSLAIKRLIEDRALSSRLSDNAYKEVTEKYTWKKRAAEILKFISK